MIEYYHADRLNYAVAGTPNRLEYDQGFFVKQGDGAADFKPIAHLYKTQVYALAEHLGVPAGDPPPPADDRHLLARRRRRRSSTSRSPTARWTSACAAVNHAVPAAEAAKVLGAHDGAGRARVPGHRGEAAGEPLPAPGAAPRRRAARRLDVRHRRLGHSPRGRAAARDRRPRGDARGAASTAAPTSSASTATGAPASPTRGSRSSTSPPASSPSATRTARCGWCSTARSSTTSSSATSSSRSGTGSARGATPR